MLLYPFFQSFFARVHTEASRTLFVKLLSVTQCGVTTVLLWSSCDTTVSLRFSGAVGHYSISAVQWSSRGSTEQVRFISAEIRHLGSSTAQ